MYSSLIFPRKTSNTITMSNEKDQSTPTAVRSGSKFKNDIIFIIILLSVVCALGAGFYLLRPEGNTVEVRVDGELMAEYPLSRDISVDIEGVGGVNRLVIHGGEASVEYADCPDGICSAHSPISRSGESIVCLPHRVIVTVKEGDTGPNDTDAPESPDIIV